jgi:Arc/MetJ-type ribon-helix-helix transcriptional regulator
MTEEGKDVAMPYQFPPDVEELVRSWMASGEYSSEDDILRDALHALVDRKADMAAIEAGIGDMNAGRVVSLDAVDARVRDNLGFSRQA